MKTLDVITIGRASVDLYGAQVGGRLEDMGSFQKYIGGSPTNMAAGTARLVGTDRARIVTEIFSLLDDEEAYAAMARAHNPFGDGTAGTQIAEIVARAR